MTLKMETIPLILALIAIVMVIVAHAVEAYSGTQMLRITQWFALGGAVLIISGAAMYFIYR